MACGILVPGPGIDQVSSAFEGEFLTSGPQEKSQVCPLLNSLSIPCLLTFLEGRWPLQARRLCEYEVPFNCSGLSWWLSGQESACNAGNAGDVWETQVLSLGSGKSPGGGNGNLLQYCCLGNSKERGLAGYSPCRSQRGGHDWAHLPCCRLSCSGCQVVLRRVHKAAALPRASLR